MSNPRIIEGTRDLEALDALQNNPRHEDPDSLEKENAQQRAMLEIERLRLANSSLSDNIKARKGYAQKTFRLCTGWLIFVGIVLIFSGISRGIHLFYSDGVLIALLTTSTANILGLLIIVLKYIYPNELNNKPD